MRVDEDLVNKYQDRINYLNAGFMFEELMKFLEQYGLEKIFNKDYENEEDCVDNYTMRAHAVKLAMDACEHFSKFILIHNNKTWDEMKSLGHNLYNAYDLLDDSDKRLVKNAVFFETPADITKDDIQGHVEKITISDMFKTPQLNDYSFEELLSSFSSGRVLPNIKTRYPGQEMVEYDEKFIIAYAITLFELCYIKMHPEELEEGETYSL